MLAYMLSIIFVVSIFSTPSPSTSLSPSLPMSSYVFLSLPCAVWNIGCASDTNIYIYIY